jgi:hypothetical protein
VDSLFELLSLVQSRLYSFRASEGIDLEFDLTREMKRVKQHFTQLKQGFINLETKQRLLQSLVAGGAVDKISPDELNTIESTVNHGRNQINELNGHIKLVAAQIQELIENVINQWNNVETDKQLFQAVYNKELTDMNKKHIEALLAHNISPYKEAELEQFLHNKDQLANELRQAVAVNHSDIQALELELETLNAKIQFYSTQLNNVHERGSEPKDENIYAQTARWYSQMNSLLNTFTGVKVICIDREANQLHIKLSLQAQWIELWLQLDQQQRFSAAQLTNCSDMMLSNTIQANLDGIMEFAVKNNDIPFFIREVSACCI